MPFLENDAWSLPSKAANSFAAIGRSQHLVQPLLHKVNQFPNHIADQTGTFQGASNTFDNPGQFNLSYLTPNGDSGSPSRNQSLSRQHMTSVEPISHGVPVRTVKGAMSRGLLPTPVSPTALSNA
ncbi:hypothetical protein Ciccas_014231, partial [Cichlidogyrus casuarinus]